MKFVKVLILIQLILCLVAPIVAGADEAAPEEPMDISKFDAVILESKGHIDHMYTTTMGKETFTTKIKYLTAKGIEDYGYVELEYDPSEENIGDIEGKVTLPDGKEIKITKDQTIC